MVGLVGGGSSQAGQQAVQSPRQVVSAVVLHCQPAVEQVEDGLAERVAADQPGAAQGQQQQGQELQRRAVLSSQGEGEVVPVVVPVDPAVQPGHPDEKHTNTFNSHCWGKSVQKWGEATSGAPRPSYNQPNTFS
ncbi:hypothetical protein OYC64_003115 [Pagothenia borchgrevinki]|uniref:Uncharacterized protein n=1 Tax=Pagothenia borchgrevinki TaxID=8213 RepID=A0ABD2HAH9_PAGBO